MSKIVATLIAGLFAASAAIAADVPSAVASVPSMSDSGVGIPSVSAKAGKKHGKKPGKKKPVAR